ncbi:glycosyltransferase [Thermoproteus tenax]|uniref:Glycosyltransferase (Type2) n=1 Tax=Thermoproteus tenax (strain ATCC 35583 / DSM 2078 / JCM 9277 / NBRC 100435 / Kra 1) TaxID=768679 RepID=G4RK92_THETK|nr:glycosyltransferase [Thermoproteus tenax]CCC81987.1 glycosyltransferase (type2) [Thermoproteus tenax Kra 1]
MIDYPLITICMPVKNRAWHLNKVLRAIEELDYPRDYLELVFVDGYSQDGSYEVLAKWRDGAIGFRRVELIRAKTNISQARNECVKRTSGDYLLFWDSDVVPPRDLLKTMVELMERDRRICIMGADYVYDEELGIKYKPVVNKEAVAVYMGFTLVRRDVFKIVSTFNEILSSGEDTEFCIKVRERARCKVMWAPKPVAHIKRPEDLRKSVIEWLKYNFTTRAKEYYTAWNSLPKFLKARILYWLSWPWAIALTAYLILSSPTLASLPLAYMLSSAYLVVRERGLRYGLMTWVKSNILIGLALSYGVAKETLNKLICALLS